MPESGLLKGETKRTLGFYYLIYKDEFHFDEGYKCEERYKATGHYIHNRFLNNVVLFNVISL